MRLSSVTKNLFAFVFGIIVLILFDLSLGLLGVVPLAQEDPFVGFSGSASLFKEAEPGRFVLDESKQHYFNTPQSFLMPKPEGHFRIVVFGGSTTYGRPFLDDTSFGTWLAKLLERYGDVGEVEVVNVGGISYASYRVRRLVEEMANYLPDLFIVYSGHNEFLEARTFADIRNQSTFVREMRGLFHHSHIYTVLTRKLGAVLPGETQKTELSDEVDATLEQVGGPDLYHRDADFRAGVIRQYRHEIKSIATFCKERAIPLLLSTLPSNLAHISPFKSEFRKDLTGADYARWQQEMAAGESALADQDLRKALTHFKNAVQIDPEYAQGQYRLGQVYQLAGFNNDAYQAFVKARDYDVVPLRALTTFSEIVKQVASDEQVPVADVAATFRRVSPGGIAGNNLFVDHVHPGIEGQQLIAWTILNAAADAAIVPLKMSKWQGLGNEAREYLREEYQKISKRYLAMGLWGVGRLYFWAGKYDEAYESLLLAWDEIKDIAEIPRQLAELELLYGNAEEALRFVSAAEQLETGNLRLITTRVSALALAGRAEEALRLLENTDRPSKGHAARYDYAHGEALYRLERFEEALSVFRLAIEQTPGVARFHLAEAETLKALGRIQEARKAYGHYLELSAHPAPEVGLAVWLREM